MSTVLAFVFHRRHLLRFVFPPQRHLADPLLLFLWSLPTAYLRIVDTPPRFPPGVPYLNFSPYIYICGLVLIHSPSTRTTTHSFFLPTAYSQFSCRI
ncbi:hypothetical protein B0H19DRAFT_1175338 [Mycena capillaripes]|nr:hypothetical protein B0H19DRAFT_1175338 [Mycena capillaripes]